MTDFPFMRRALELAELGRFGVSPNPMAGCVIERGGLIVGEGFHRRAGEPHAEVEALRGCEGDLSDATAWVTLEPCAHQGRTAPCTDALIERRVGTVMVATEDPFPEVNGSGIARLREAGVRVEVGACRSEANTLNETFFHSVTTGRPFLLLKAGMTLDGKLATVDRQSRWITSSEARRQSLSFREEYDAVLVGSGTLVADNPQLTRRLGLNKSITPWRRVIVDSSGRLPATSTVFNDGGLTTVFTTHPESIPEREGVELVSVTSKEGKVDLEMVLDALNQRGVRSLIAEGGSLLHSELIRKRLWQKMVLFVAPMMVGGASAPSIFAGEGIGSLSAAHQFRFERVERVGPDVMLTIYPQ